MHLKSETGPIEVLLRNSNAPSFSSLARELQGIKEETPESPANTPTKQKSPKKSHESKTELPSISIPGTSKLDQEESHEVCSRHLHIHSLLYSFFMNKNCS